MTAGQSCVEQLLDIGGIANTLFLDSAALPILCFREDEDATQEHPHPSCEEQSSGQH
jgi:hypothetical protein